MNETPSRNVMVTGGAGFIGSHLVEALAARGSRITVFDNVSSGAWTNLDGFAETAEAKGGELKKVEASILDADALRDAAAGCDTVFHLAALGSVPGSVADPVGYVEVNVTGTLNVLEAARAAGVRRVVLASSSSVYGTSEELPKLETMPVEPASPYASTKAAGEALLRGYAESYGSDGLDCVSLRFFNVYGPRQSAKSQYAAVIAAFADAVLDGRHPTIFGDGEQSRDFVYVGDVVQALTKAADADEPLGGAVFNVATGHRVTVNELAQELATQAGRADLTAEHLPERAGDVKHSGAAIDRIVDRLGFAPTVSLDEGLGHTVRWYADHRDA